MLCMKSRIIRRFHHLGMRKENDLLYWIIVILVILILLGFVFGRGRMF